MTMIEKKTIHCTACKKNPHGAIGTSNRKTRHQPAVDAAKMLEKLNEISPPRFNSKTEL